MTTDLAQWYEGSGDNQQAYEEAQREYQAWFAALSPAEQRHEADLAFRAPPMDGDADASSGAPSGEAAHLAELRRIAYVVGLSNTWAKDTLTESGYRCSLCLAWSLYGEYKDHLDRCVYLSARKLRSHGLLSF